MEQWCPGMPQRRPSIGCGALCWFGRLAPQFHSVLQLLATGVQSHAATQSQAFGFSVVRTPYARIGLGKRMTAYVRAESEDERLGVILHTTL